jgi:predicted ATPase
MIMAQLYVRSIRLRREEVPDFSSYPFSIPAIRELQELPLTQVTFLVGENGTGKSTLLEAIAIAAGFNAEGGSRNFSFATHASHSKLHGHLTLVRSSRRLRDGFFFRAESFFNVASEAERLGVLDSYGGRSLHEQSHGESFLALLQHRFSDGLYMLDEPEAALSPARQLAALRMIHDRVVRGAQFVIATHAPILLAYPGASIFQLSETGISAVAYQDTEHFRLSRDFFAAPDRMLKVLLDDD